MYYNQSVDRLVLYVIQLGTAFGQNGYEPVL